MPIKLTIEEIAGSVFRYMNPDVDEDTLKILVDGYHANSTLMDLFRGTDGKFGSEKEPETEPEISVDTSQCDIAHLFSKNVDKNGQFTMIYTSSEGNTKMITTKCLNEVMEDVERVLELRVKDS